MCFQCHSIQLPSIWFHLVMKPNEWNQPIGCLQIWRQINRWVDPFWFSLRTCKYFSRWIKDMNPLTLSFSPLECLTEARVRQSCSSSSLGRWSMDVLRGSMERGFFFFIRSGEESHETLWDTMEDWINSLLSFSQPSCSVLHVSEKMNPPTWFVFRFCSRSGFSWYLVNC